MRGWPFLDRYLMALAQESVRQPISQPVPANDAHYLAEAGWRKLGWRNARRHLRYRLSGQAQWLRSRLELHWRRGLWLYMGVPQVGDALMDLAPRSLLRENGLQIDLLTHTHLANLFQNDPWFDCVMDSLPKRLAAYDFVILPSHKHRSLVAKRGPLAQLPWLSMHGFYTGPEFQRAQLATQRLADVLGLRLDTAAFAAHARQKLGPALPPCLPPQPHLACVALALGGVDPLRCYAHWPAVAVALARYGVREISLIGSANGLELAQQVVAQVDAARTRTRVHNHVGRTTLHGCARLLRGHHMLASADGGLMHLGLAVGLPVVSLFSASVQAQWRLPANALPHALQSRSGGVNAIEAEQVATALIRLMCIPTPPPPPPHDA